MPSPTISLCMITRNEEAFLGDCLKSVRGICHQLIVVDTGSTDRTMEIARAAGATVVETPWTDDFAAARNVGVELATGTHILVLDADERLAPGMGPNLLEGAANPDLLLGCLPLYNASTMDATTDEVLDGVKRLGQQVFVPRLFVNHPQMRFERRVHETLTGGFNKLQSQGMGHSIAVGAALIHYGDVPSHRVDHAKDERNEALLRLSLNDDPSDGEVAGYLVVHLIKTGQQDEAMAVGERHFGPFVRRNETRPKGHLPENMVRIGYSLGLVQVELGHPARALETLEDAQRFTPDGHPNLDYVEGLAAFGTGDFERSETAFRSALAAHGKNFAQPVLPFITNELPRIKMAGIELQRGRPEDALAILPPPSGKWRFAVDLVRAEIHLAQHEPAEAMECLAQYVDLPRVAPDWHMLVHKAMTDLGRETDGLLDHARGAARTEWLEQRRAGASVVAGVGFADGP